jgi:hypothetical protein
MIREYEAHVILSREDGEGSPNAKPLYFEILRFAQDDGDLLPG